MIFALLLFFAEISCSEYNELVDNLYTSRSLPAELKQEIAAVLLSEKPEKCAVNAMRSDL